MNDTYIYSKSENKLVQKPEWRKAVINYMELPSHRQIEIWRKMGYQEKFRLDILLIENDKAFMDWVRDNNKKDEFLEVMGYPRQSISVSPELKLEDGKEYKEGVDFYLGYPPTPIAESEEEYKEFVADQQREPNWHAKRNYAYPFTQHSSGFGNSIEKFIGTSVFYDREGQCIFGRVSEDGIQLLLDVRGWGAIQNLFKSKIGDANWAAAGKFQDELGEWIADAINKKLQSLLSSEGEDELWNEVGAIFHGSVGFNCYKHTLDELNSKFTIKKK